jgi:hypothetical protein
LSRIAWKPKGIEQMARLPRLRNFDVLLLLFSACLALSACEGPVTAWSAESRSPDGRWIATAEAIETNGIGVGDPGTFVSLNWTSGGQVPRLILALSPYLSSSPPITKVGMNWLTPTHLELTYSGKMTVNFQAIRCDGVEISVRVLSEGTSP